MISATIILQIAVAYENLGTSNGHSNRNSSNPLYSDERKCRFYISKSFSETPPTIFRSREFFSYVFSFFVLGFADFLFKWDLTTFHFSLAPWMLYKNAFIFHIIYFIYFFLTKYNDEAIEKMATPEMSLWSLFFPILFFLFYMHVSLLIICRFFLAFHWILFFISVWCFIFTSKFIIYFYWVVNPWFSTKE